MTLKFVSGLTEKVKIDICSENVNVFLDTP